MLAFLERLDHQLFFALNQGLSTVGLDYLLWVVTWCADGFILVAMRRRYAVVRRPSDLLPAL